MSRRRLDSTLLREQAAAFEAKAKAAEAKERAKQNADEHRRSVLAGQAALFRMQTDPGCAFAAELLGLINERAISKADRALFGLPSKGTESTPSAAQ